LKKSGGLALPEDTPKPQIAVGKQKSFGFSFEKKMI
jgi:hypothetical protein